MTEKITKKVLLIGNDPEKQMIFTSDNYEWTIEAVHLPIFIVVKNKKDGTIIRIFTTETVEERWWYRNEE